MPLKQPVLQVDDAVRVVITNAKFNGVVPNSMVYRMLPRKSGSANIAKYLAPGVNRIVLVHVDDKCKDSTLW
jgi:hypothetical protein